MEGFYFFFKAIIESVYKKFRSFYRGGIGGQIGYDLLKVLHFVTQGNEGRIQVSLDFSATFSYST